MGRTEREARVAEIATLEHPLRSDLYALLVERDDWVSRDEAAAALQLPRAVATFHLERLADAGLVDVRFQRPAGRGGPGAGRPAKQYRRTENEISVSLPDRRYDLAGALLADAVADATRTGTPVAEALATAARRTGREIGEEAPNAFDALERLGYEPRERDGEIVLANCPFHRLVERHQPLVCSMNLELLSGLVDGAGVKGMRPRLDPTEGTCCVRFA